MGVPLDQGPCGWEDAPGSSVVRTDSPLPWWCLTVVENPEFAPSQVADGLLPRPTPSLSEEKSTHRIELGRTMVSWE